MRKIVIILVISSLIFTSCQGYWEKKKVREIISTTFVSTLTQLKEVDIEKDKIRILPLKVYEESDFQFHHSLKKGIEYKVVEYTYKTNGDCYKMYYLIDFENQSIMDKSSDPDDFYVPYFRYLFKKDYKKGTVEYDSIVFDYCLL